MAIALSSTACAFFCILGRRDWNDDGGLKAVTTKTK
ncbi:hypothetical protein A2U01_0064981, partial [Trifolium medium]|nr:hypothetical protein [Trifolium medium]